MKNRYKLSLLEEKIGYTFKKQELLKQALTHSSYANELKLNQCGDYERLEFLGDAVLEMTVSEGLFLMPPPMGEGTMTRLRAGLVCEPTLAGCAREIELQHFIFLGKGEEMTGGRKRDSIISDVFEALIGAIYLDGGYQKASDFVNRYVLNDLEHKILFYDSKTILQEKMQLKGHKVSYSLLAESGPDHDKTYVSAVQVGQTFLGKGQGHSKKSAEQKAAYQALMKLRETEE